MLVHQGALRKSAVIRRFVAISIVKWVVLYLKYRTWLTFLSRYQVGGAKKNSADHWLVKWSRGPKKSWLASRLSGRKNPKGLSRRAVSSHNPGHLLFVLLFVCLFLSASGLILHFFSFHDQSTTPNYFTAFNTFTHDARELRMYSLPQIPNVSSLDRFIRARRLSDV